MPYTAAKLKIDVKLDISTESGELQELPMKSRWMEYKGKRILYIDLSDFRQDERSFDEELKFTVETIGQEMYQQLIHSVLVLVDLRNTVMTQKVQTRLTERIKDTRQYVSRTAVIGMTGIRKMFLDFFARLAQSETVPFDTPEAGLDWLTSAK